MNPLEDRIVGVAIVVRVVAPARGVRRRARAALEPHRATAHAVVAIDGRRSRM